VAPLRRSGSAPPIHYGAWRVEGEIFLENAKEQENMNTVGHKSAAKKKREPAGRPDQNLWPGRRSNHAGLIQNPSWGLQERGCGITTIPGAQARAGGGMRRN